MPAHCIVMLSSLTWSLLLKCLAALPYFVSEREYYGTSLALCNKHFYLMLANTRNYCILFCAYLERLVLGSV